MTVEVKGNKLVITCELSEPTPSASGKTLVIASSRGIVTTNAQVNGKPVQVGVNAFIGR